MVHGELEVGLIDIWREYADAHGTALVHELDDFGDVVEVTAQRTSHVLCGVVRLEVGCLIGDPAVAGSMALVEGVAGELCPVGPDLLQRVLLVALLRATSEELHLQLGHLVGELLTHRLTQAVRLPTREVGDLTGE